MKNSQHRPEALSADGIDTIDAIIVVPALNEAAHIEKVIGDLRRDGAGGRRYALWVVDGGSQDGTRAIVRRLAQADSHLRLIHNPQRTQASAVNLAAAIAKREGRARYLIRADAHARYPSGWASLLVATAEETGADSVVTPMRTCGGGAVRDASADLFNSWLGNGGSPHRSGKVRGFVEHGHHALFRLDAFLEAGGYDPLFLANEDAELDVRLGALGRRIFLENRAVIDYFPRATLGGVFRQYHRNGRYRLCTGLKHARGLGPRQLAPMALAGGLIGSLFGGVLVHPLLLMPAVLYASVLIAGAARVASRKTPGRIGLIALIAASAHVAFGLGAMRTLIAWLAGRPTPPTARAGARKTPPRGGERAQQTG